MLGDCLPIPFSGIESCLNLHRGFTLLARTGFHLHTLTVRHDSYELGDHGRIEDCLVSFKGLNRLYMLVEGSRTVQNLDPILAAHGKTLCSLLWEERNRPRRSAYKSTAIFRSASGHLWSVARHCPRLVSLGLTLEWQELMESENCQRDVSGPITHAYLDPLADWDSSGSGFRRLKHLQCLSIRNMPGALQYPERGSHLESWYRGLVATLLKFSAVERPIENRRNFEICAIGAPVYSSLKIGRNHFAHHLDDEFLKFRMYRIKMGTPGAAAMAIGPIAEGSLIAALDGVLDKSIFGVYWLG